MPQLGGETAPVFVVSKLPVEKDFCESKEKPPGWSAQRPGAKEIPNEEANSSIGQSCLDAPFVSIPD